MANQEQLEILKQGVEIWNQWRRETRSVSVDISGAVFDEADLRRVSLYESNLTQASFTKADLCEAKIYRANLTKSNLYQANLNGASFYESDLTSANLSKANLYQAYLYKAKLNETNLYETNLTGADLRESSFSKARLYGTIFGISGLDEATGLEDVIHDGPSTIGIDTIVMSKGRIPDVFLRGCGLSDTDIEYAKLSDPSLSNDGINKILYKIYDLRASQALQISPLFISYSHSDSIFVDKLEIYLNKKGIRFWRDIHDMKSGRMETQIDRAMRLNSTVLLILSEHSVKSDWVEHEVRSARNLEKEMTKDVLCPIALDGSWKNSPWSKRVMEQVMEYNILDFSEWKDNAKFGSTFNKLIDGLELFYK